MRRASIRFYNLMVCERPLLGMAAGSELACLVRDGEPGFAVFDQNPIHYAIMYRSLLNDMELLVTMSKRAAEHVQECVREKIAKEVGDVYQDLGEIMVAPESARIIEPV